MRDGVPFCSDFSGSITNAEVEEGCVSKLGGTFSESPCDRTNAVGGCEFSQNGQESITWFYAGAGVTEDSVSQACAQVDQSFVKP
ncbi:hypothetical protein A7982_12529 [Minicystis rosea]|nr:hypothetical protein A7982_12529 [Minicystis rosea]